MSAVWSAPARHCGTRAAAHADAPIWLHVGGGVLVGMAAQEITITGLEHHEPESLLSAIGVQPGGSLMGFDAVRARNILQNLYWIESAKVQRLFPNQLVVEVRERAVRRIVGRLARDGARRGGD